MAGILAVSQPRAGPLRRPVAMTAAAPPRAAAVRMIRRSLYEVLRVGETAAAGEIKAAYRAMAKRLHPDGGGGVEAFLEIRRAYETLSDPGARARYDRSVGRCRAPAAVGAMRPRRWETDQCW